MIKYLILSCLVIGQAHASFKDIKVIQFKDQSEEAGVSLLKKHLEESRYVSRTTTFAFEKISSDKSSNKNNRYTNGDFVILWGVGSESKDQNITELEYKGMWRMMNYLSNQKFRVVMNTRAISADLAEALASRTSSVVVYSSHGNERRFYDFDSNAIPTDIFKNRASNVYQFVLSACYGSYALRNYNVPRDLYVYSWPDLTNPEELLNFLVSDEYSALTGKKR